jgi:hypothetical protein
MVVYLGGIALDLVEDVHLLLVTKEHLRQGTIERHVWS